MGAEGDMTERDETPDDGGNEEQGDAKTPAGPSHRSAGDGFGGCTRVHHRCADP